MVMVRVRVTITVRARIRVMVSLIFRFVVDPCTCGQNVYTKLPILSCLFAVELIDSYFYPGCRFCIPFLRENREHYQSKTFVRVVCD
jgi:hypothetical protein